MRSSLLSRLSPAIGQQLIEFVGLHGIDSGQDVGKIFDGIDVVSLTRSHEREVDRGGASAGIGAYKQAVLSHQHEVFDGLFGDIVVDVEIWILEEARQSKPVVESVFTGRHQRICRIESCFETDNFVAKLFNQGLGTDAPGCKPLCRRLVFNVPLYVVEFFVDIQDDLASLWFDWKAIEVSPSGMRVASNFSSRGISEEGIEATSGVGLNAGTDVFEPSFVSFERLIGREIKNGELEFSGDVDGHFAFAHSSFDFTVLNLDFRIIGIDDLGLANVASHQLVEGLKGECGFNRAITLCRARDDRIFALESFFLAVMGQSVAESAGNDVCAKSGSELTASFFGFFSGDDVDLTFLARPNFLLMFEVSQRMDKLVELVAEFVANEGCSDVAVRASCILFGNGVSDRLEGKVVLSDVFSRNVRVGSRSLWGGGGCFSWCSLRVVALSFRAEVFAISFFELDDEDIELFLKVLELQPEVFLSNESLAELFTKFGGTPVGLSEKLFLFRIFSLQAIEFGVV